MSAAVVIVSKSVANLRACVTSVRMHEPDVSSDHIIVVDQDPSEYVANFCTQEHLTRVLATEPRNFAKCASDGLSVALFGLNCAVLLQDDVLLRTPNGITEMIEVCAQQPEIGLLSASSHDVSNRNQFPAGSQTVRREEFSLSFLCIAVPQHTWLRVGQFDENQRRSRVEQEYCERILKAGLQLGVWDRCLVDRMAQPFTVDPNEQMRPRPTVAQRK